LGSTNSVFLRRLFFKFVVLKNWRLSFSRIISSSALPGSKNWLRGFGQSFGKQAFLFGKVSFCGNRHFRWLSSLSRHKVKFLQSASKFSVEVLANWLWFAKSFFSASTLASLALAFCSSAVLVFAKSSLPKIKLCVKVNQVGCGSAFQLASLAKSGLPNKACTRRWGFGGIFKHFPTPQHFSNRTASRRPPQRG